MRDFQTPGRSLAVGSNGAAATSHPLSTYAAIEVLRNGGNAVDAALTACSLQSVLEPHNTGLGGDCFAFVWREDLAEVHAINGAGWAPEALNAEFLLKAGIPAIDPNGVHAVTIPGALDAWVRLLADHGTRTLAEILQPTIAYAEAGVVLAERAAVDWAREVGKLGRDEGARAQLLNNGKAPSAGDRIRFPVLARTLRIIAAEGSDSFYRGGIARDLVATLSGLGGRHSLEDFAAFASHYVEPIGVEYRGVRVLQMPPSGQGLTTLVMLNILADFPHADLDPAGAERIHLQIEAARLAYAVRDAFIADPEFESVPTAELLSPSFADSLREKINLLRASSAEPTLPIVTQRDTVCLTVVDGAGNACSLVNSLFDAFGCGKVCPRTGVVFQSRGAGFRVEPGHPNSLVGRKRPLHTIIPAMAMRDGKPFLSFGVMGGAFQPVGQVQFLQNVVDFGMDVQEALDAPRGFCTAVTFEAERGISDGTLGTLSRMGHSVGRAAHPFGGGQAIEIDRNREILKAGSDPRKDGVALAI
jgi:gamma-glutamyltranspeptidase / glutathione hydrolase